MSKCKVCSAEATVEVLLYDVYADGRVYFRPDSTCPFLCARHVAENEERAKEHVQTAGVNPEELGRPVNSAELLAMEFEDRPTPNRRARAVMVYPYTNRNRANGFTIYRPLKN